MSSLDSSCSGDHLVVENRILYQRYEGSDGDISLQVVAPKEIREDIMQQLHEGAFGAHLGENKTLYQLRERFYWPGHSDDVRNWYKTCATCAARKNPRAPLQNVVAGYPMQIVAVVELGTIITFCANQSCAVRSLVRMI
eukprot:Em0006g669a